MRRIDLPTIDSTSSEIRRHAADLAGEPLAVVAREQSAGRGRHGRVWHSPVGGAWLSVAWPLRNPPSEYAAVPLVAALAVADAVLSLAPELNSRLQIKWPNDILVDDGKLAGILCEQFQAAGAWVLTVGVGVNVALDPSLLGSDLRHPATSLQALVPRPITANEVAVQVIDQLGAGFSAYERAGLAPAMLESLSQRLAYRDQLRTIQLATGELTGRIRGLDSAGRLLLSTGDTIVAIDSGELITNG